MVLTIYIDSKARIDPDTKELTINSGIEMNLSTFQTLSIAIFTWVIILNYCCSYYSENHEPYEPPPLEDRTIRNEALRRIEEMQENQVLQ